MISMAVPVDSLFSLLRLFCGHFFILYSHVFLKPFLSFAVVLYLQLNGPAEFIISWHCHTSKRNWWIYFQKKIGRGQFIWHTLVDCLFALNREFVWGDFGKLTRGGLGLSETGQKLLVLKSTVSLCKQPDTWEAKRSSGNGTKEEQWDNARKSCLCFYDVYLGTFII